MRVPVSQRRRLGSNPHPWRGASMARSEPRGRALTPHHRRAAAPAWRVLRSQSRLVQRTARQTRQSLLARSYPRRASRTLRLPGRCPAAPPAGPAAPAAPPADPAAPAAAARASAAPSMACSCGGMSPAGAAAGAAVPSGSSCCAALRVMRRCRTERSWVHRSSTSVSPAGEVLGDLRGG